jgi:beta-lactamase superfamily II metal-dependent hydrolase
MALAVGIGYRTTAAAAMQSQSPLILRFLDVGDGDATWISLPDGETALIDCGSASYGKQLVLRLQAAGIDRVDQLIMTHGAANAVGGCGDVLGHMVIGSVTWNGLPGDPQVWAPLQSQVLYFAPAVQTATAGSVVNFGGATLSVYQRPPDGTPNDALDSSVVLLLEYGGWRTLLPGAIHANGELNALNSGLGYPVHILEVADGGSEAASSNAFLQAIFRPDLGQSCRAAISSQAPDRRGSATAASVYARFGAGLCQQVFVTADSGTVIAQVPADGSAPRISSER